MHMHSITTHATDGEFECLELHQFRDYYGSNYENPAYAKEIKRNPDYQGDPIQSANQSPDSFGNSYWSAFPTDTKIRSFVIRQMRIPTTAD